MLTTLQACQTYKLEDPWPADLPVRKVFIEEYLVKKGLSEASEKELAYHLGWVKKFYQGTTLYPNGWLHASERYIVSIKSEKEQQDVARRLRELGIKISSEWALDNDVRVITSPMIATWASAMRTAAEREEQLNFLDKVEKDVVALLDLQISAGDIKYENYFADEMFDDF